MNRILLTIFSFLCIVIINAQIIISNDTSFCTPQSIDLYALSATQSSMQVDDMHDVVVPLGFNFQFYGNTYNSCVVSGNGYVTFDTTVANTGSPWAINVAIPNPGQMPENAIMAPWQDINTGVSGSIYYGTTGIAPNRKFTVTWCEIAMFSCTQDLHTSQVVIHEGSNKIEMFLQDKPLCLTWNAGAAVQGLVDANSVNADIVDDPTLFMPRNFPLTWTATNEGWEFIPNGPNSYNINQIPYSPIIAGSATWTDNNGAIIGVGPSVTVSPSITSTYYCSVTGNCADSSLIDSITISISGCLDIGLASTQASCLGTDGTISVTPDISTTTPPWLIELQDFNGLNIQVANNIMNSTYIFSNVVTGSYIVKITESNGDSDQDTIVVTQIQNPINMNTSITQHVSCFGGDNGSIAVTPSGGSLPYQFYINGVLNTNPFPYDSVFTDLFPGIYVVSVIDSDNCMNKDTVFIGQPNFPLQLTTNAEKFLNCYNTPSGSAVAMATGGTPVYSYEWFDGSYNPIGTSDSISGLSGGSYFAKVTDANGCDTFATIQVLQMQTPLVSNNQVLGVACKGDSTGVIVAQATGSQSPYRYYWFMPSGDSILKSNTDQFSFSRDTLKNLPSGTYDLHIYDANGCFENYTITVGEPAVSLSIDSILVSNTVTCYGESTGSAQMYVSGGMPNYYYLWDNGEQGSNAIQLNAGFHTVELTDDWGCVVHDSVYISENPEIVSTIVVDNEVSCYGLSDGSVSVTSVGGVPSYTYFWSNGWTQIGNSSTNSGLVYGSYYLTTQDIYGCNVFDSVLVAQPDPLFVESSEIDSISCYGYDDGLAYAYASGGTSPYTFYWDSLSGYIGDTNGMLSPGVHTVYVVDSRGCQATDTVLTHEPPVFEVDILDQHTILPYCIGVASASLTSLANGGTPPYTYQWDDNPITPQTSPIASNLLAGIYTITVTDSRGCIVTDTKDIDTVTNTMTSTVSSLIMYNGYHVSCYGANDGMLRVVGGGTDHLPLTYQWYGPNGFNSINDTIVDLVAGTYSVTVLDTNLCAVNTSFDITTPDALEYTVLGVLRHESCEGSCNAQLNIDLTGGVAPYTGISTDFNSGTVITSLMIGDSILGDLCSGVWDISLTDVNGCSSSVMPGGISNQTVGFVNQTSAQVDMNSIVNVLCYGSSTGSLDVYNPNISSNYSYTWENVNNPGVSVGTGFSAVNLPAGYYVLMAQYTDSLNFGPYMGCTNRDTVEITQIDEIIIQAVIRDVDCYGNNTGRISVNPNLGGSISGGNSNYILQWNPLGTGSGQTINNLVAGFYSLSVEDANGCVKVDTFDVSEPNLLVVSLSQSGADLTSTVTGGVPGYLYQWKEFSNPGVVLSQGISYTVLTPGSYYLEVEDANGCIVQSDTVTYMETSLDLITDLDVSIYPNPFTSYTKLDFGQVIIKSEVKVVDMLGNVVDIYEIDNQRELIIERGTKSKGVYFVEININNNKIFKKITIK